MAGFPLFLENINNTKNLLVIFLKFLKKIRNFAKFLKNKEMEIILLHRNIHIGPKTETRTPFPIVPIPAPVWAQCDWAIIQASNWHWETWDKCEKFLHIKKRTLNTGENKTTHFSYLHADFITLFDKSQNLCFWAPGNKSGKITEILEKSGNQYMRGKKR